VHSVVEPVALGAIASVRVTLVPEEGSTPKWLLESVEAVQLDRDAAFLAPMNTWLTPGPAGTLTATGTVVGQAGDGVGAGASGFHGPLHGLNQLLQEQDVATGSMVLYASPACLISSMTKTMTASPLTHVGIIVREDDGHLVVYEATGNTDSTRDAAHQGVANNYVGVHVRWRGPCLEHWHVSWERGWVGGWVGVPLGGCCHMTVHRGLPPEAGADLVLPLACVLRVCGAVL
jgi:hypothetical protein